MGDDLVDSIEQVARDRDVAGGKVVLGGAHVPWTTLCRSLD